MVFGFVRRGWGRLKGWGSKVKNTYGRIKGWGSRQYGRARGVGNYIKSLASRLKARFTRSRGLTPVQQVQRVIQNQRRKRKTLQFRETGVIRKQRFD